MTRIITAADRARALAKLPPMPDHWHPRPETVVHLERWEPAASSSAAPAAIVAERRQRSRQAREMVRHRRRIEAAAQKPVATEGAA